MGAAETGSGKTLAFGLPILTGILKIKEKNNKKISHIDQVESDPEASDFENDIDESGE